ncbi:T9SS type A sorting domain-containing protein [Candidatus Kryptobacter tengchongensis]|uniref:T9SS type A sorting domain-containing protein n=1 Tax=Kryptobacter tengchongensis TaxID=1643429 RepID=UPI000707939C|nr:T9SS type A sorting domain-containing protein [Candidatus Kryptobacter tengchongensis]CUS77662.1 Por secretion system C-terminal sorting domain-containing protein [Candidatus Kryptobacter tengchongensis]
MRNVILFLIVFSLAVTLFAQTTKKWDGEGGDNLWTTAANWNPNGVPTDADSVVLDNTYISGSYDVIIPHDSSLGKAICKKLVIGYAGNQNTIRLILFSNASVDALKFGDSQSGNDDFVIDQGGVFINASNASGGNYIRRFSSSDIFRVKTGGKYVHVTRASFSDPFSINNSIFESGSVNEVNTRVNIIITVSGRTFGHYILASDSGSVSYRASSFGSDFTVLNNFIVKSNSSLSWSSGGVGKVNLKGDFIVDGTVNIDREVIFNGTSQQTIGGSGQLNVDTLTINNLAGVSLGPSISVIDTNLIFVSGKLTVDPANAIKVVGSITGAGDGKFVDGKLTYPVSSTGSKKWETGQGSDYLPVTIDFTDLVGSGDVTVSVIDSVTQRPDGPLGNNKVLRRWFRIQQSGISSFQANITFSYSDADLARQGITDENSLRVFKWDGTQWIELNVIARDVDNNTITVSGVSSFSDFVISGTGDAPLPVQVVNVSAEVVGNVVKLRIKTQVEREDFLGFNIYRGRGDENYILVGSYQSEASLRAKGNGAFGSDYEFVDKGVVESGKYYYRIEAVSRYERKDIDVIQVVVDVPKKYALYQNYPNPFNPYTTIKFELPVASSVRLELYNSAGQKVKDLFVGELPAGYHEVRVDGRDLSSGVYFYVLRANDFVGIKKMVLVK